MANMTRGRTPPPRQARSTRPAAWGPWERRTWVKHEPTAVAGLYDACLNAVYSVQFFRHTTAWGEVIQLMIRRHDGQPIHSWADLQCIKDDLIGTERVAIEVYPAASRVVDAANMYHLWVLPEGMELPFCLGDMKATVQKAVGYGHA